ncbi:Beta-hexosaminidase [Mycena indigotica]|uniref:beta-N-acetylhexosaminidase n=1 Tax=Mycena indigotica TaxID=2126181 RepID=A0A8H6TI15_9AGAR|nr:Beta-hexosaminidase [Mycena indigotica]KAF7316105.1 Beta-hexosaminidase [Mycena indigotica]
MLSFFQVAVVAACVIGAAAETLTGIPTFDFNITSTNKLYLSSLTHVLVDSRFQRSVDLAGETLIPPTLLQFGQTFAADLKVLGFTDIPVQVADRAQPGSIFLTLSTDRAFLDAAGRNTSEGYTLTVGTKDVVIAGASPLGAFWGTRTLLQQAKLGGNALLIGSGSDSPGWATRGVMLDGGRHFYPPEFIIEICSYLSFFKQNTFHLHLSDNLFNNVDIYTRQRSLELYAAFRLNSDDPAVSGLVKPYRFNESYTRETFDNMQASCAARGVTIIPEIEAPGHALVISQWKPELGLADLSLLNISHPETIPTMESIWKTFLPWFKSKTVHIGADEYDSSLANDYNLFVNTMSSFIRDNSGKDIRIWGTNEPSRSSSVSPNITIQHWEFFEDNPLALIKQGYRVLNADDAFYIVGKWSGSYPQQLNLTRIFTGDPAGGAYAPNIFDTHNATNNPARSDPGVIGHIAAQWNDYGPNATTVTEAYYAWRDALPALADKQWGGRLTQQQYSLIFDELHGVIPGQNLDRAIPSKTEVILEYKFSGHTQAETVVDSSGNGYDGACKACSIADGILTLSTGISLLKTPLTSKGRNYTLAFGINPSSRAPVGATIFSGPDSTLVLGNGTAPQVALISANQFYALNFTLPRDVWSDVQLLGRGNATFLRVGKGPEMQFLTVMGINGQSFQFQPIAIEAPLAQIGGGGFIGSFRSIKLLNTV